MGPLPKISVDVAAPGVYRPPPSSLAVFDINAIEEPWLKSCEPQDDRKQPSQLPAPILEKLNAIEDAPRTWEEVSKALEDLKPKLISVPLLQYSLKPEDPTPPAAMGEPVPPKSLTTFHTLEELEAKISPKESVPAESKQVSNLKKLNSTKADPRIDQIDLRNWSNNPDVPKSLKDNIFIKIDKLERQKEGKTSGFVKRDPLAEFEERCPPDGADSVVLYTTSLGGVRRTYEDCNIVRTLMETHRIVFDERDISLHGGFLNELKELLGEGVTVPRLFVKGRYLGGVEQVVHLNETGRLPRILNWARVERGVGRLGCEGCGGARFLPCFDCGGSCKIVVEGKKEKCGVCNENGLVQCPACI
ncbi:electron transporter [Dorcoceras hygrometricum]|uniref:Electron transporter n=1 Tax=Dorcoceras hygrometricum TaxID=472368 RepID=A0A2Z7BII9_9LAMI|nr:electron transporter [Dorcoceras hygrometricum]